MHRDSRGSKLDPNGDASPGEEPRALRRTLSLPLLVFYGLGVTVGAGIFALVGEILGLAGDQAALGFLVAGVIVSFTGISYMRLVAEYPRAGGEAVYVRRGFGDMAGRFVGIGVIATGVISSAVVALAFAGYVTTLISVPERSAAVGLVLILGCIACWGVRESVALAAIITTLEVGTLLVVVVFGLPEVDVAALPDAFNPFADGALGPVLAGAGIAFFAFIGFEDIANMAEETLDPRRTAPRAIAWTLGLTMIAYVTLALIAISLPARSEIVDSSAPVATIFETVSSLDPAPVATVASLAMINGILAQLIMASRVLYGMASDGQLPSELGVVNATRRTPIRATAVVCSLIVVLTITFPLLALARVTSIITLTVFTLVNGSLVRLAYDFRDGPLWSWRFNGMAGALAAASIGIWQIVDLLR